MTQILNNVDLDKVSQTTAMGKKDKSTLRKPVKLQGEWILDSVIGYQFKTELPYENGKQVIEIDSPSFLGGNGNRLGPMAYCVAGLASCFIATFVTVAAGRGTRLTKLTTSVECKINFAKTFDVADEPACPQLAIRRMPGAKSLRGQDADRCREAAGGQAAPRLCAHPKLFQIMCASLTLS